MKNKRMLSVMTLAIALISCSACKKDVEEPVVEASPITWDTCKNEIGDHPCDFTLKDQNGEDWNLYENYGKIIILDFSAEWCGYCQVAAAETQLIQDEYGDDITYVTVLIEDRYGEPGNAELLDRWSQYFEITAPVLAGSRDIIDSTGENGWVVTGWPTFYFITNEMVIHSVIRGYSPDGILVTLDSMLIEDSEDKN